MWQDPRERLKLHILNLGHTVLAQCWMADRLRPDLTVREILELDGYRNLLAEIYGWAANGFRTKPRILRDPRSWQTCVWRAGTMRASTRGEFGKFVGRFTDTVGCRALEPQATGYRVALPSDTP